MITCNNTSGANYANGDTTTFTIVVTVNAATADGTVITDTVNAKGANTAVATASANVTVQTPDLAASETVAPNPVATGANITYTETVTNNSTTVAAVGSHADANYAGQYNLRVGHSARGLDLRHHSGGRCNWNNRLHG